MSDQKLEGTENRESVFLFGVSNVLIGSKHNVQEFSKCIQKSSFSKKKNDICAFYLWRPKCKDWTTHLSFSKLLDILTGYVHCNKELGVSLSEEKRGKSITHRKQNGQFPYFCGLRHLSLSSWPLGIKASLQQFTKQFGKHAGLNIQPRRKQNFWKVLHLRSCDPKIFFLGYCKNTLRSGCCWLNRLHWQWPFRELGCQEWEWKLWMSIQEHIEVFWSKSTALNFLLMIVISSTRMPAMRTEAPGLWMRIASRRVIARIYTSLVAFGGWDLGDPGLRVESGWVRVGCYLPPISEGKTWTGNRAPAAAAWDCNSRTVFGNCVQPAIFFTCRLTKQDQIFGPSLPFSSVKTHKIDNPPDLFVYTAVRLCVFSLVRAHEHHRPRLTIAQILGWTANRRTRNGAQILFSRWKEEDNSQAQILINVQFRVLFRVFKIIQNPFTSVWFGQGTYFDMFTRCMFILGSQFIVQLCVFLRSIVLTRQLLGIIASFPQQFQLQFSSVHFWWPNSSCLAYSSYFHLDKTEGTKKAVCVTENHRLWSFVLPFWNVQKVCYVHSRQIIFSSKKNFWVVLCVQVNIKLSFATTMHGHLHSLSLSLSVWFFLVFEFFSSNNWGVRFILRLNQVPRNEKSGCFGLFVVRLSKKAKFYWHEQK